MRVVIADLTCRTAPYDVHLVRALRRRGVATELWCAGCPDSWRATFPEVSEAPLLDLVERLLGPGQLRKSLKAGEYLWNMHVLRTHVRTARPDILHLQWLPFVERLPAVDFWHLDHLQRLGIKVVYTAHNVLPHHASPEAADIYARLYCRVDGLICHTEEARGRILQLGVPSKRVWTVPHGPLTLSTVDEALQAKAASAAAKLNSGPSVVLLFGSIKRYKGVEFLLKAWSEVRSKQTNAQLVLAGFGDERYLEEIKALTSTLNVTDSVDCQFRFLSEMELSILIHAADVVVFPYREITQSGALLTAMEAGKAIVATRVGGFPETLQDGKVGVLVDYGDVSGLADSVSELLDAPEKRAKLGERASQRMQGAYSWKQIASKTTRCYDYVLNS